MHKICYIIGSGASIRKNQWNIPATSLPIWNLLKDKCTMTLNWGYKFIDPTIALFCDHRFFDTEYNNINKLNLLITQDNSYYQRESGKCEYLLNKNLFLLKNAKGDGLETKGIIPAYWEKNSWKNGFYCSQLSGIFAISLAVQLGFEQIILLGYDGNDTDEHTHFYDDDNITGHMIWQNQAVTGVGKKDNKFNTSNYNKVKELNNYFDKLSIEKDKILNVNLDSAINTFQKISYITLINIIQNDKNINKLEIQEEIKNIIRENNDK